METVGPRYRQTELKELKNRIKELESGLRTVLNASELWLPAQGELLLEEFAGEAQALCTMYSNLKELLKED